MVSLENLLILMNFFIVLREDKLLAPFSRYFDFSDAHGIQSAIEERIAAKQAKLDELIKIFVDSDEYDRLKREKERFNEAHQAFEANLQKKGQFSVYEPLRSKIEYGNLSTEEDLIYRNLLASYAQTDYQMLKDQEKKASIALGNLCQQAREKMQKASPKELQKAKQVLEIGSLDSTQLETRYPFPLNG